MKDANLSPDYGTSIFDLDKLCSSMLSKSDSCLLRWQSVYRGAATQEKQQVLEG